MISLDQSWKQLLEKETKKEYFSSIVEFIKSEKRNGQLVFPENGRFLRAFEETPAQKVKVVILGQDPYHGRGQADGLCFSVQKNEKIPPSLRNIFTELNNDIGIDIPNHGCLVDWANRGVLLLNSILSVRENAPMSHREIGWETFVGNTLKFLVGLEQTIVFIAWGVNAKNAISSHLCGSVGAENKFIISSPHPSPFSACRGFFGSKPFSRANSLLVKNGSSEVDWEIF